jgi:HEPN domain-containing protein
MAKKELILDWMRHAENDVISARILFEYSWPRQTEIAAWHSQQCAEKALKAFLISRDIEPPKIHDLLRLLVLCRNIENDFSMLKSLCKRLTPFGSEIRYPNELAADEAIAEAAMEDAQRIYDFCAVKINPLIQDEEIKI